MKITLSSKPVAGLLKLCGRSTRSAVTAGLVAAAVGVAHAQSLGISTLSGVAGQPGSTDTTGGTPKFTTPQGVTVDSSGNVYVADSANNKIRKITGGGVVTTLATGFNFPAGVAVDGSGNVFVADTFNHVIKKVTSGGVVSVIAGTSGTSGASVASATGAAALFNGPQGIATDSAGTTLYVADTGNHVIRMIAVGGTPATSTVTEIAGTRGVTGFDATHFSSPEAVALDATSNLLYVADTNNHAIRKIDLGNSNALTTLAGTGSAGSTDSSGGTPTFNHPVGVAVDSSHNVFIADFSNNTIRKSTSGGTVTTVAGNAGTSGSTDAVGTSARFNGPWGIAVDSSGNIFIGDSNNQTIRKGAVTATASIASGPTPASQIFVIGTTPSVTFGVTVNGSPTPTIQWQRAPASSPTSFADISDGSSNGVTVSGSTTTTLTITAATTANAGDKFRAVATNSGGSANSTAATLLIAPVFTSANSANFSIGTQQNFTVSAVGSGTITYTVQSGTLPSWMDGGLNSSTGVMSASTGANNANGAPFTITLRATSSTAGFTDQVFTINVSTSSPATISSQPSNQTVNSGQTATFNASASGVPTPTVKWQRAPASSPTSFSDLSNDSTYSGVTTNTLTVTNVSNLMSGDQFRFVASNTGATVNSNTVSLIVNNTAPSINQNPSNSTIDPGQNTSFTASAVGSPSPSYRWQRQPNGTSGFVDLSDDGTYGGTTSGTLTVSNATTAMNGDQFRMVATNANGSASSSAATLTINSAAPTITTQPVSATVQLGANATFTAVAAGSPSPSLRWQRQPAGTAGFVDLTDDSTYSGTGSGTLTVSSVQAGMSGDQFRVVATNSAGSVTSSTVTLTVNVGTAITTIAGKASLSGAIDGTGTDARLNTPAAIAYDPSSGNFYVADAANHVIRRVTATGSVSTFAGTAGSSGSVDGSGAAARFNGPSALTVDSVGNVYVADTYNQTIRLITAGGAVTTIAGLANNSGSADGTGTAARFAFPSGIVVDSSGNLYVSDTSNHTIRRVTSSGSVSTIAGSPGATGSNNASGSSARFNFPEGLALDSSGNLYVADSLNHAIRKIQSVTFGGNTVSTVAGSVGNSGSNDANGTSAKFNQPIGVTVDSSGVVYVADTYNDTIRKIATNGDVTTLAGLAAQTGADDGVGSAARFNQPFGIALDANGNLFIADTRNNTIRRSGTTSAPSITTQPQNRIGVVGSSTTFTVVATGVPAPSYQWQRQPAGTSGFSSLVNGSLSGVTYSGVNTASLTASNLFQVNDGDQFRVVVNNGISPAATSDPATLTIGTAPIITSVPIATFIVGQANTFNVTATSAVSVTYSATGLPSWLTLNASTGVLSGTPPDAISSPLAFTIAASNGAVTTQNFSLTLVVPQVAPSISVQPVGGALNPGDNAVFTVTATGTAPLSYQWNKNGVPLTGATGSSLSLSSVQPTNAGNYTVTVTNSVSSVTSNVATLAINAAPTISVQPRSQTVAPGSSVTFSVTASGSPSPTYQWRVNGVAIGGATSPSYTIGTVIAANAGNYDVVVGNVFGQLVSSVAQLVVSSGSVAPTITSQPVSRTALVGTSTTLTIAATGVPAPTYQWRKNGSLIAGATSSSYVVGPVQTGDAGNYDVIVSNSVATVFSNQATLSVIRRSFAGVYFGNFGSGLGTFAIYIRPDNTGVFLGFLPGSNVPVKNLSFTVSDTGVFSFTQSASGGITTSSLDGEPRAAAAGDIGFSGTIDSNGGLTGAVTGVAGASLTASKAVDNGGTQAVTGFYSAAAANTSATLLSIAGSNGQAFVLTQNSTTSDGGMGTVDAGGHIVVATSRQVVSLNVNPTAATLTGTAVAGATSTTFSGGSEAVIAAQRLGNISTRANVGAGNNVAIAGFVISGTDSKPVLIRAIGPTMAGFGFANPLTAPKLELVSSSNVSLANNTGWSTAPNTSAIVAASVAAGAFPLSATSADSVILTTLAPGNYTAVVSSANGGTGVALIEVYDLSSATTGQKLFNISTRANAGTGLNALAAGFVINGSVPKRLLIRGAGPALTQFGVPGALPALQLQVVNSSNQVVAQNIGWGTSADAAAIATAATQVGAFPFVSGSGDSAVIVSLAPGNYTAQINPIGSSNGIAIIEVYELP